MRFMMIMHVDPDIREDEYGPTPELVGEMTRYNDELVKAGALLSADGLLPPHRGARITWPDGKVTVTDGPFAEAKEVVGGFWVIQARSKEEAVEWASRIPANSGAFVEVRQVAEMSDFSEEIQEAAKL